MPRLAFPSLFAQRPSRHLRPILVVEDDDRVVHLDGAVPIAAPRRRLERSAALPGHAEHSVRLLRPHLVQAVRRQTDRVHVP